MTESIMYVLHIAILLLMQYCGYAAYINFREAKYSSIAFLQVAQSTIGQDGPL